MRCPSAFRKRLFFCTCVVAFQAFLAPATLSQTTLHYRMQEIPSNVREISTLNNLQMVSPWSSPHSDTGNYVGTGTTNIPFGNFPAPLSFPVGFVNGALTNFAGVDTTRQSYGTALSGDGEWFGAYLSSRPLVINRNPTPQGLALLWNPSFGKEIADSDIGPISLNSYPAFIGGESSLVGGPWFWEYAQVRPLNEVFSAGSEWDLSNGMWLNAQMEVVGWGTRRGQKRFFKASRRGVEDLWPESGRASINNLGTILLDVGTNAVIIKNGIASLLVDSVENREGSMLFNFSNINDYDQVAALAWNGTTNRSVMLSPSTFGDSVYPPLTNDLYISNAQLSGLEVAAAANNLTATKDPGEPNHAGDQGGASVWWRWTAPATTNVTVTTAGSAIDTLLGIYKTIGIGRLSLVASNDNFSAHHLFSQVEFPAEAGKTYYFAVDGKGGARGHLVLRLTTSPGIPNRPPNDQLASVTHIPYNNFEAAGSTIGATLDPVEPAGERKSSVWYTWVGAASNTFTLRARKIPNSVPVKIEVYAGTLSNLTAVPVSDVWAPAEEWSRIRFTQKLGESYYCAISDAGAESGFFNISPAPANDQIADATPLSAGLDESFQYTTSGASLEPGEPTNSAPSFRSLWWRYDPVRTEKLGLVANDRLEIFEGSSLANLQALPRSGSGWVAPVLAGHTYWIRLSRSEDIAASGLLFTSHFPVYADDPSDDTVMIGPFDREVKIAGNPALVYRYTPIEDEALRITLAGLGAGSTSPRLLIGTNGPGGSFSEINPPNSRYGGEPFPVRGGITYFIKVAQSLAPYSPLPLSFQYWLQHGMRILGIKADASNQFSLNLPPTSVSYYDFALEASSDLRNWTTVRANTNEPFGGYLPDSTWTLTNSSHFPQQFFRIREFPKQK